jgi:rhodanese-related sulfurtransferase
MSQSSGLVMKKSPADVAADIAKGCRHHLIDVRTEVEYAAVHAVGARLFPLDRFSPADVPDDGTPVAILCKAGGRAAKACQAMVQAGRSNVFVVEGGTDAWIAAGLAVERRAGVVSLERQVRIAAGLLVLLGIVLAWTVHPYLIGLSAFIGLGLTVAGITDTCGMAMVLAKMPWNRVARDQS